MAIKALRHYKLKLNSVDKVEELLQELYNETCKNIEQIQNEMNKLSSSIVLANEAIDAKTKYAKAMNDFMTNKDKALGRKLDIAKLMAEVLKFNGDLKKTMDESEAVGDWGDFINNLNEMKGDKDAPDANEVIEYKL